MTEQKYVVDSLLTHLATMPDYPWKVIRLQKTQSPAETGRETFAEVVLPAELREAIVRLNPWLQTDQVDHALTTILSPPHGSLLETNQFVTHLLCNGYPDTNRSTGEAETVRYVSLDDPALNRYVAVEEFKLRVPGTNDKHIRPDVVLFVNGLPWVVIECKAPKNTGEEIAKAIDQMQRYSNQRGFADEGNPALFGTTYAWWPLAAPWPSSAPSPPILKAISTSGLSPTLSSWTTCPTGPVRPTNRTGWCVECFTPLPCSTCNGASRYSPRTKARARP